MVRRDGKYFIRAASIIPRRERWNSRELTAEQPLATADELQAAASVCGRLVGKAAAGVASMALCDAVQVESSDPQRGSTGLVALAEAELHQPLEGYVLAGWPAVLQADKYNVVAMPAAWSDQASADITAGRWNCRQLQSVPWALARAAGLVDSGGSRRTVATLDWGYSRATLCLVQGGVPATVRCLKECGFDETLTAISRALRLDQVDAEKLLRMPGLATADNAFLTGSNATRIVADALAEPLHRLEGEVRRTLAYWRGQAQGVRPETLYLFGGGASLAGLEARLKSALDLDVQVWRLPHDNAADAEHAPPAHLLGAAVAASSLAWEAL